MEATPEVLQEPAIAERSRKKGRHGLGYTFKHNGSWWMDVRIRGKRHREKLGPVKLLQKRDADEIREARITNILMPKAPEPPPEKGTMPFRSLLASLLRGPAKRSGVGNDAEERRQTRHHSPMRRSSLSKRRSRTSARTELKISECIFSINVLGLDD